MKVHVLVGVLFASLVSGCGTSRETSERQKLVAELVSRGDSAESQDKHFAYQWALRYATGDDEVSKKISAKLECVPRVVDLMKTGESERLAGVFSQLKDIHTFVPWPKPDRDMAAVELRLLLDRDLVGDLRYTSFNIRGAGAYIFTNRPKLTVAQVIEKYGSPSGQTQNALLYGHIGFATDSGRILAVLAAPVQ